MNNLDRATSRFSFLKRLYSQFAIIAFFVILSILTTVTIVSSKKAESEARELRRELDELNVTAQNRCIVLAVLSFPPPITQEQHAVVLGNFDQCIVEQTGKIDQRTGRAK
jgi:uncharacterized membrane protein